MKRVEVPTGVFNIAIGFNILFNQTEDVSETRYLNALKGRLQDTYAIDLQDMTSIASPDIVHKLSSFLKSQEVSDGYRRNLVSRLYKVLKLSPQLEDLSYIRDAWKKELENKISPESLHSQALLYWFEYVERIKKMPGIIGQDNLSAFADYLATEKDFARNGSAYNRRRTVRDILAKAGLFDPGTDNSLKLSSKLEKQLQLISEYAQNHHLTEEAKNSLFLEDYGGNPKQIESETVKKLRFQVNTWVRFYENVNKSVVEGLDQLLDIDFLKLFLDSCYKDNSITKQTAASALDNAKSLKRLGVGSRAIKGTPKSVEAFRKKIKPLYESLKKFKKDGINAKLKKAGGLPSLVKLHHSWIKNLEKKRHKWTEAFKYLDSKMKPHELDSLLSSYLLEVRGAVLMGLSMFVAPRCGDIVDLKVEYFRKVDKYWHLNFIPDKTDHHFNAPEVDVSLPSWLTGLIDDYLLIRRFIHDESPYFFPPSKVHQDKSGREIQMGHKKSVSFGQFTTLSKKWFDEELSGNKFRKILSTTYKMYGLRDLYEAAGHSPRSASYEDRGFLTEVESSNYLIGNDELLIRKAKFRSDLLAEEFKVSNDTELGFLSARSRSILKSGI